MRLGVWNTPFWAVLLEGSVFVFGPLSCLRVTEAKNKAGRFGLWALVVILAAIYVANLVGPAPPSAGAVAWAGQLQWLFVLCGFWVDRNRFAYVSANRREVRGSQ